jgi:DNA modification methylase
MEPMQDASITRLQTGWNGMGSDAARKQTHRNKRSVWTVPTKPFKEAHFAVFPLNLIRPCIQAGCPSGGIILDPFLGSGTTAVGAIIYSRGYVGIELNPEYVEMAKARLARVKARIEKNLHA